MGKRPVHAWVYLLSEDESIPRFMDPEDLLESAMPPEVYIAPAEKISSLDFRFLAGVTVHLQGKNKDRLRQAYAQLKMCDPHRIIVSSPDMLYDTGERTCTT